MMIRRSKRDADRLDAFLEGRASAVPDELAPLAELAEELRTEAQAHSLDSGVAATHVADALAALQQAQRSRPPAPTPAPVRSPRPTGRWRLQAGAALAGVALLAFPAAAASAGALPGDVLYPVKRGVEQVRLMAAVSPQAEAETRTHIAHVRLEEVTELLAESRWEQVSDARGSLDDAHDQAMDAVAAAKLDGAEEITISELETELAAVPEEEAEVVEMTLDQLPPDEAETVRTLIAPPDEGEDSDDPTTGTDDAVPGVDPTPTPTPTPDVSPTPTPDPSTTTSSSTSTTTTSTTSTSTTSTTTSTTTTSTTLPPDVSAPSPSAGDQAGTPLP